MGRKFSLQRKKFYWKNRDTSALLVSIPLDKVKLQTLEPEPAPAVTTTLPLSYLNMCSEFKAKIAACVPKEWVDVTPECMEGSPVAFLCRPLCCSNANVIVKYTLRIENDCSWSIWLHDKHINPVQHTLLLSVCMPDKLTTPEDILSLITVLENAKVCIGHPDEKYHNLLRQRDGKFYEQTGMLM